MEKDTSTENNELLREILQILKGSNDQPGLMRTVHEHDIILKGENGGMGLLQKVMVMWRAHVWLLCSMSAVIGWIAKTFIKP